MRLPDELQVPRAPAVVADTVRTPCRPAIAQDGATAALRMAEKARAAGWQVMVTYAAGMETRRVKTAVEGVAEGRDHARKYEMCPVDALRETVALRALLPGYAYRWMVWDRWPGGTWKASAGYGWSVDHPIMPVPFSGTHW